VSAVLAVSGPAGRYSSVAVGERFSKQVTLDEASISRFALSVEDHNPLHHDAAYARGTRFGGIIASGTQYTALLMGLVATHFSAQASAAGLEFSFQLKKAVRAGDTITLQWTVAAVEPKASLQGDIVTLNGTIANQDGEQVLTCVGKVVVFGTPPAPAFVGSV
jgi:acyl dehydratase